ncbi:MAG TPA: hypothetical protein PKB09_01100 [Candidatus Saccharibacteria bacterium]|nr:hypothetical protein [Candidatus Saccharibacteria bacterium]
MLEEQATQNSYNKPKKSRKKFKKILAVIAFIALLLVGGYVTYNYIQEQNAKIDRLSNPQEAAKDEVNKLLTVVGQTTELPAGEIPTLATVSNAAKLKNQAFFKNAENGDKVLIFTKAKKAYLYRPSTNKIVEIAPINIGDNTKNTNQKDQ